MHEILKPLAEGILLAIPRVVSALETCPNCGKLSQATFDDYDVATGGWNPEPGRFAIDGYCPHCEHEWLWKCRVEVEDDATENPREPDSVFIRLKCICNEGELEQLEIRVRRVRRGSDGADRHRIPGLPGPI